MQIYNSMSGPTPDRKIQPNTQSTVRGKNRREHMTKSVMWKGLVRQRQILDDFACIKKHFVTFLCHGAAVTARPQLQGSTFVMKRVGIIVTRIKRAWIHFLSDVFTNVAIVVSYLRNPTWGIDAWRENITTGHRTRPRLFTVPYFSVRSSRYSASYH